jgi:putative FmdB family regulatory protein
MVKPADLRNYDTARQGCATCQHAAHPLYWRRIMPTYEYICEKCDHQFDVFQSMKDKPLAVCPQEKCAMKKWGKGKLKKMVSGGGGLIFKGSGFYITDYRSDSYKEAAKKDAPPSAGGESSGGKTEKKAETKSESKSESKPAKAESKPAKSEK